MLTTTPFVIVVGLLQTAPSSLLSDTYPAASERPAIVISRLSLLPCSVSCNPRCWAIVVVLFPVVRFPFPHTWPTPIAFSMVGYCLKLATMSNSHSKSLKVNLLAPQKRPSQQANREALPQRGLVNEAPQACSCIPDKQEDPIHSRH